MLHMPYARVWMLLTGMLGLFMLALVQNTLARGAFTWAVLATAGGTTLWWSILISLVLWLHHALNLRLQRERNRTI